MANTTMFDDFFDDLNVFLQTFAENNGLPAVVSDFRPIMNRENGTKIRGDFSLNFVSPKYHLWHKYLPQICDQLLADSNDWKTFPIESFRINEKISRILLFINRSKAVPKVIENFADILLKTQLDSTKSHIICVLFDVKNEFSAERIRKVSESVSKLLATTYIDFNYKKISDQMFDKLLSSAEKSVFCESNVNNKLIFKQNIGSSNQSTDDTNNILIDRSSKVTFELIWNLYEFVKTNLKCDSNDTIVLITSETVCYRIKQSFRLMCLLFDLKLNLKLISVSNVNTDQNFTDYIQTLTDNLMEQNDSSFKSTDNFQIIIDTSVTLSLLSTTISSVVTHLDPHLSESTFIQYNCARLKSIINRYNCEFESNPTNNRTLDLTLLTHDLEWSLILNQFSNYYSIINSLNNYFDSNSNQKCFGLNQLILFLKGFVSEVSVYYKKVKVLTEPSPHLLSLIAVRIHFCQLLLDLFINCLNILGLKTVEKL